MKKIIIFMLLLSSLSAQNIYSISGKVSDVDTGAPLEAVNVFLSGTTWGAATDSKGFFEIKNLPKGSHQMIVSMIGYITNRKNILISNESATDVNFKLKSQPYELDKIVVSAKEDNEWRSNFSLFRKYFLGTTEYSAECEIENKYIIDFHENSDGLVASIPQPLIITNNALGYKIKVFLDQLTIDENRKNVKYELETLFTEMIPASEDQKLNWIKNRDYIYNLSFNKFLISLLNGTEKDLGYNLTYGEYNVLNGLVEYYQIFQKDSIILRDTKGKNLILKFDGYLRADYQNGIKVSELKLLSNEIVIDEYGYTVEYNPFRLYGHWGSAGLACELPKYFNPEE